MQLIGDLDAELESLGLASYKSVLQDMGVETLADLQYLDEVREFFH